MVPSIGASLAHRISRQPPLARKRSAQLDIDQAVSEIYGIFESTAGVAQNARRAGVKRRVSVYEGMFHVFQMSMDLVPESREAWDEVARFMQIVYKIDRRPTGQIVKKVKRRR